MPDQAQGIAKQVIYKRQTAKGAPESGSGGQLLRRETATFSQAKDRFSPSEMNSHRQHVGDTYGAKAVSGTVNGNLSPLTYADFMENVMRGGFAAVAAITGMGITIAASGDDWTLTRAAGSWLSDGVKVGMIGRLTAGTFDAANSNKNLVVQEVVSATVLRVSPVNGVALVAEGPIAGATLSFPGQRLVAAIAAHTNDYFTIEERYTDIGRSRIFEDMQCGRIDINIAANGVATIALAFMGLDRTKDSSQALTTPSDETTTPVLNGTNGLILLAGAETYIATSLNFSIDLQMAQGEATIGSKKRTDNVKNDLIVNGNVTLLFEDEDTSANFDNETAFSIIAVITDTAAADSDFIVFTINAAKMMSDDTDDGKKQLIISTPFNGGIRGDGGAGTQYDKTTITIQDSEVS